MEFFLFSGMLTAAHVSRASARSGASQFARRASADNRYDTLSRVRTPGTLSFGMEFFFRDAYAAVSDNAELCKIESHKYSTQKIFRIDDGHVGITEIL